MLDAKTIYATLFLGLAACGGSEKPADNTTNPTATATATASAAMPMPTETATAAATPPTATAVASGTAAPMPSGSAKATAAKLPAGRTTPKAPKDGKTVPASASKRTGADACCGAGTCGPC